MSKQTQLPGTPLHQQILHTITNIYKNDTRVTAVILFGSVSRGNWDAYSDLDLDIIMADHVIINAEVELNQLCANLKQQHTLDAIIIANEEEGDVVLSNLIEFSIRYHYLHDTKPAILDTMTVLSGTLEPKIIHQSANQAYQSSPKAVATLIDQALRYTLGLHHAIMRQRVWMGMELLHRLRGTLIELYATCHGAERSVHFFDAQATQAQLQLLTPLAPAADLNGLKTAFQAAVHLIDNRLDKFCHQVKLLSPQQAIISQLKQLTVHT